MSELVRPTATDAGRDPSQPSESKQLAVSRSPALRRLGSRATTPAVFLLFLGIATGLLIDVWRAPLTHIDGTQDALQTIWFMTWPPYALIHHQSPFISDYMNYPAGVNLLWNTSATGPAILLWPVTTIWNAVLSYNVVMTASMALSGLFAFIAIRRYILGTLPAVAGAAIYGFSPYMMAHIQGHLHSVASAVTAPLLLLLLDELLIRQRIHPRVLALLLALLLVCQFFTHEENFVTEIMAGALIAVLLALMFRSKIAARTTYVRRTLVIAVPLTLAILAYPLYVQLVGPERVLGGIHDPDVYVTDALNLVVPDPLQLITPSAAGGLSAQFTGNASEWNGYLGIPLLLISIVAPVRFWKVPLVRIAAIMAVLITLLSLGPHLHVAGKVTPVPLPWWIAARIPLVRDVIPSRLMVYVYLAVALILAFTLSRLAVSRAGAVLALAVAGAALVPLTPTFPLRSQPVTAPSFFRSASVTIIPQGTVVMAIPWASPESIQQMDPMVWAAESHMRFRILGGYFLNPPSPRQRELRTFADELAGPRPPASLTSTERDRIRGLLRANRVGALILDAVPAHQASRDLLIVLLGTAPRDIGGIDLWLLPAGAPI